MREIKFRAWYKNEMCSIQEINFDYKGNICNISLLTESGGEYTTPKKMNLMQYTGLKDKNGVEIYEGDIVRITSKYRAIYNGIYKIKFERYQDNESYRDNIHLGYIAINNKNRHTIYDINKTCEVIGNIYENPNLINNKT